MDPRPGTHRALWLPGGAAADPKTGHLRRLLSAGRGLHRHRLIRPRTDGPPRG